MENNELFTGVLDDPRVDPRVKNGFNIDEILPATAAVDWKKKSISELKKYPVWNQHSTSACVAFAKAKQISIRIFNMTGVWIDFSPASIYQLRANKGSGGMNISDANEIVNESGATLEALMKSQNLTEAQINAVKRTKVADLFAKATAEAVVRYLYATIDIDKIAHQSIPPTTTAQQDIVTAGQRKVNLIWEFTQAFIAIIVVLANMISAVYNVFMNREIDVPMILSSSLFLIIGFYFSRTNHQAIGGTGEKPIQPYEGR